MQYAVIIDLDYENHPYETCETIWKSIREQMLKQDFHQDGRRFVTNLPEKEACERARKAVDAVEAHLDYLDKHLPLYIKNFYGFSLSNVVNLLVPPLENIQVQEPGHWPR